MEALLFQLRFTKSFDLAEALGTRSCEELVLQAAFTRREGIVHISSPLNMGNVND